jgi:hypothetical protein
MMKRHSPVQFKWAILRYSFTEEGQKHFFRLVDNADRWKKYPARGQENVGIRLRRQGMD